MGMTINGPFTSSVEYLGDCPNIWRYDGLCSILRTYVYTFSNVSGAFLQMPAYNLAFTPTGASCTTSNHSGLSYLDCSYYTTHRPEVYVFDSQNGQVDVSTTCGLLCYPFFTICNTGGYFKYRKNGVLGWTTANFTGSNLYHLLLSSLSAGTYEYSTQLTYPCGNSLVKVGTFEVN